MKKLIIIATALVFFACSAKKEQKISLMEVGKPAPNLIIEKIIQPKGEEFENLRQFKGKLLVLSFFASWRNNSLEGLNVLNGLYEEFSDSIVFMAVTDEEPNEIGKFLRKNRIAGWLGVSVPAESFKNFRVYDRPMSILIANDGRVVDFMDTNNLNSAIIKKYIAPTEGE